MTRRRFNTRERVAMYLAARGRCQRCGQRLEPGWHGDHKIPYSKSGPTDVINGAALCPTCNIKKGNTMNVDRQPRDWQVAAHAVAMSGASPLIEAAPSTGKTWFAFNVALERLERGDIDQIIWVVPTDSLRDQVRDEAAEQGIALTATFANADGHWASDYIGAVVTYQQVARQPDLYRMLSTAEPTLVVIDEIHHCSRDENSTWGPALQLAFDQARYRLLLTGTPFRHDGHPIPWVDYDVDDRAQPNFKYGYREAVRDGVVRFVRFDVFDAEVHWIDVTDHKLRLQDVLKGDESRALRTAIDPASGWIDAGLRRANAELDAARGDGYPDLGGLVVCSSVAAADAIAANLRVITGEDALVVHQEMADPKAVIKMFKDGQQRWLVAVNMISEGVDIPRLGVGVYATNVRTDLRFRQMVGRTTRTLDDSDDHVATWVVPSAPSIVKLAKRLADEAEAGLRDAEDELERSAREGAARADGIFVKLGADDVRHTESVLHGDSIEGAMMAQMEALKARFGLRDDAAKLARAIGSLGIPAPAPPTGPASQQSVDARRSVKSKRLAKMSRTLAMHLGLEHIHVEGALNGMIGVKGKRSKTASEAQLDDGIRLVSEALLCDRADQIAWL